MTPQPAAVWTTPALLRLGIFAVWLASVLLMAATLGGVLWDRASLRVIGRELAPGITEVKRVHQAFLDLDRAAESDESNFDDARQKAADELLNAAENISSRDLEAAPIHQLGRLMSAYDVEIQRARDLRRAGDKRAMDYERVAHALQEQIFGVVDGLDNTMNRAFQAAFERQAGTATVLLRFVVSTAFLLGAILAGLQLFLVRRTRRVINPMIFCATAITLLFSVYTVNTLEKENRGIRYLQQSQITQPQFEREVTSSFQEIAGFEWTAPLATVAIAALTAVGVLPRLREYSS